MPRSFHRLLTAAGLLSFLVALPACDSTDPIDGPFAEAEANIGEWTFIDVEGAQCRDGSPTGFGIRLQEDAENLAIYLQGGGACFNDATCGSNSSSYSEAEFGAFAAQSGDVALFSTAASNPVGDWNMVYVPYCTGDVHGGSVSNATVPGVDGAQQFVGHQNIERYLDLLVPYFGDPDQVLLTGTSAGGFGALINFSEVADRFDDSQLTLLNDSGPIFFADNVYSPPLSASFSQLYDFDAALPADAAQLFQPDGFQGVYEFYDARYPDATFGLASHLEDQTIRYFFGFGQPDGTVTGEEYAAGLRDIRAELPDSWVTYYAPGDDHTFLTTSSRFTGTVDGVALNEWVGDLLDGTATDVDPETPPAIAAR